jgi:hypothetical protein
LNCNSRQFPGTENPADGIAEAAHRERGARTLRKSACGASNFLRGRAIFPFQLRK